MRSAALKHLAQLDPGQAAEAGSGLWFSAAVAAVTLITDVQRRPTARIPWILPRSSVYLLNGRVEPAATSCGCSVSCLCAVSASIVVAG